MKFYKSLVEARKDGWAIMPCALPTTYAYYTKDGGNTIKRADELVEGMEPTPIMKHPLINERNFNAAN